MAFKKFIQTLIISLAITFPAILSAQVEITARATAEVIVAINAVEGAILNFGRFSPKMAVERSGYFPTEHEPLAVRLYWVEGFTTLPHFTLQDNPNTLLQ